MHFLSIDTLWLARGRIFHEMWAPATDFLSIDTLWPAKGKIFPPKQAPAPQIIVVNKLIIAGKNGMFMIY